MPYFLPKYASQTKHNLSCPAHHKGSCLFLSDCPKRRRPNVQKYPGNHLFIGYKVNQEYPGHSCVHGIRRHLRGIIRLLSAILSTCRIFLKLVGLSRRLSVFLELPEFFSGTWPCGVFPAFGSTFSRHLAAYFQQMSAFFSGTA